jgi:hypothetical protein
VLRKASNSSTDSGRGADGGFAVGPAAAAGDGGFGVAPAPEEASWLVGGAESFGISVDVAISSRREVAASRRLMSVVRLCILFAAAMLLIYSEVVILRSWRFPAR